MNGRYWSYLFFADLIAELAAIELQWNNMRLFTKPLLMIILLAWVIITSSKYLPLRNYIAAALFFSCLGDVFLLMEEKLSFGFLLGLVCFLAAHIIYILFFLQLRKKQLSPVPWNPFIIAAVIVYAASLFIFLYPHIGNLKIPVAIYSLTISVMLITAAHAFSQYKQYAAVFCIAGALLFLVSDSLLSINKFCCAFPAAGIFIMLTYGLAQFAITKGSLQYLAIVYNPEKKVNSS
jgi:uncharacterized membrane protein YhhN